MSFNRWLRVSPGASNGFTLLNGEIATYGGGDFGLLYYAAEAFADFTLRVQFRLFYRLENADDEELLKRGLGKPAIVVITRCSPRAPTRARRCTCVCARTAARAEWCASQTS